MTLEEVAQELDRYPEDWSMRLRLIEGNILEGNMSEAQRLIRDSPEDYPLPEELQARLHILLTEGAEAVRRLHEGDPHWNLVWETNPPPVEPVPAPVIASGGLAPPPSATSEPESGAASAEAEEDTAPLTNDQGGAEAFAPPPPSVLDGEDESAATTKVVTVGEETVSEVDETTVEPQPTPDAAPGPVESDVSGAVAEPAEALVEEEASSPEPEVETPLEAPESIAEPSAETITEASDGEAAPSEEVPDDAKDALVDSLLIDDFDNDDYIRPASPSTRAESPSGVQNEVEGAMRKEESKPAPKFKLSPGAAPTPDPPESAGDVTQENANGLGVSKKRPSSRFPVKSTKPASASPPAAGGEKKKIPTRRMIVSRKQREEGTS